MGYEPDGTEWTAERILEEINNLNNSGDEIRVTEFERQYWSRLVAMEEALNYQRNPPIELVREHKYRVQEFWASLYRQYNLKPGRSYGLCVFSGVITEGQEGDIWRI